MSDREPASPLALARGAWNTLLTVYYANSVAWRTLKAGALFFLGFFLWAGSNVLLSYRPDWWILRYSMAYGFVLVVYGPFHHLVVIPGYLRLRRRGRNVALGRHLHLPNASLAVFLVLVVVLGTFPPAAMVIDLRGSMADAGVDVDPDLLCVRSPGPENATIHCHLSESTGVSRVVVRSGHRTLVEDDRPPFEFTIAEADLVETAGRERFRVELLDADGRLIRRYARTPSMIPVG